MHLVNVSRNALFQLEIPKVFSNLTSIEEMLVNDFGMATAGVKSLIGAKLDIPKMIFGMPMGGGIPYEEVLCDWRLLKRFVVLSKSAADLGVTIEDVSNALCNVTSKEWVNNAIVFLDEANVEAVVEAMSTITVENFAMYAGVPLDDANFAAQSLADALRKLKNDFKEEIEGLSDVFDAVQNLTEHHEDYEATEYAGEIACGDKDAFNFNFNFDSGETETTTVSTTTPAGTTTVGTTMTTVSSNVTRPPPPPPDRCKDFIKFLDGLDYGDVAWSVIAPILRGKILFTPISSYTTEIARNAQVFFEELDPGVKMLITYLSLVDDILTLGEMDEELEYFGYMVHSTVTQAAVHRFLDEDDDMLGFFYDLTMNDVNAFIDENADTFKAIQTLRDGFSCYRAKRFEGIESEAELETASIEYHNVDLFEAGLVFAAQDGDFETLESKRFKRSLNETLPTHIKYKIRLGLDETAETFQIKPK